MEREEAYEAIEITPGSSDAGGAGINEGQIHS
jgi:hypothetical protein